MTVISERRETKELSAKICSGLVPAEFPGCNIGRRNLPEIRGHSLEVRESKIARICGTDYRRESCTDRAPEMWTEFSASLWVNTDQCMNVSHGFEKDH